MVALVVAALCWVFGWREFLLVETPLVILAGGAGIWLFYVQHQFEGSYWKHNDEWSFEQAGLHGSSYLRLPRVLQFFSGNIGFHHVHHLNPKIPNYNLQRAHEEQAIFRTVPVLSPRQALAAVRLKVWDDATARMVTWKQAR
jgi:omega-6 fatty acid desaturase (delta-12 desaturase)